MTPAERGAITRDRHDTPAFRQAHGGLSYYQVIGRKGGRPTIRQQADRLWAERQPVTFGSGRPHRTPRIIRGQSRPTGARAAGRRKGGGFAGAFRCSRNR